MNNKITWEWLGGFFDGEGSIQIVAAKSPATKKWSIHHYVMINIGQKDKLILEKIKCFTGIGHLSRINNQTGGFYIYCTQTELAKKVLTRLIPYLQCKRIQAQYALQFMKYKKHEQPLSKEELRWREMHRQLVMFHNRRLKNV